MNPRYWGRFRERKAIVARRRIDRSSGVHIGRVRELIEAHFIGVDAVGVERDDEWGRGLGQRQHGERHRRNDEQRDGGPGDRYHRRRFIHLC